MKVIFLGCGYLGYNLTSLCTSYFDTVCLGLKSEYSDLLVDKMEIVDVFNQIELDKIDFKGAIVVDTITLVSNLAKPENEQEALKSVLDKYEMLFDILNQKQIETFVMFSSGGTVYGSSEIPVKETSELMPVSFYAKSKVAVEELLQESRLNYLILRVSNPFGGVQSTNKRQGVIPILIEKALTGESFEMWGSSESVRDYIYINDFAMALKKLIENHVQNEVVNIGSGKGTSLSDVIEMIEQEVGKKIRKQVVKSQVNLVDSIILDIMELKRLTGFTPQTSFHEAIKIEVTRVKNEKEKKL